MSKKSKSPDSSLAFVDVITNGLGGLLILFFLVVLMQTQLEWTNESADVKSQKRRDSDPFVIIVKSKNSANCFDPASNQKLWQIDGDPRTSLSKERGINWDFGASYAMLILDRPLSLNAEVSLRTPAVATEFDVQVYPSGAMPISYSVHSRADGPMTEIWPALSRRSK